MRRILITGTNRGIGLELVRRYAQQDDTQIFATCRNPDQAAELQAVAKPYPDRVSVIPLEVTSQESIDEAARLVSAQVDGLDMLINNAGVLPGGLGNQEASSTRFGALEADAMLEVFRVNTISPVIIAQAFADLLRNGTNARVINVSSDAGSIAMRNGGGNYSYPASKAALNMMTRCLAGNFRGNSVLVVSLHPGWVQTDMGGPNATLTLEQAVPSIIKVVDGLTMADSGKFFNWDGKEVPW